MARRGRRRSKQSGGRDHFDLRAGDERPKGDPKEEKSTALVVLFFVMVVVAVCVAIILRSVEGESFPGL